MNLQNLRILVDNYNLELHGGTGTKTYGISLVSALQQLNATVKLLCSEPPKKRQRLTSTSIDEIIFQPSFKNELTYLDYYTSYFLKTLFSIPLIAKQLPSQVELSGERQSNDINTLLDNSNFFYLPLCYQAANQCFKKFSLKSKIIIPEPIDIWHTTYPLPIQIAGTKKITTIHDLVPYRLPAVTLDNQKFFYRLLKTTLDTSDLIITISENTKQDLVDVFRYPADKIAVTYQPITLDCSARTEAKINSYLQKYKLQASNYILFVGAIEPKKNLSRLIDAYIMSSTNLPLVIVGKKGWLWQQDLAKLDSLSTGEAKSKQVIVLNFVSNEDLEYLYRGAYCTIFPSLYEGFGLPALEAISFSCPLITSNTSSLPEVCKDAALYVNPYNANDIASKLDYITQNPSLRQNLAKLGRARAEFFSQEKYRERLLAAYQRVL